MNLDLVAEKLQGEPDYRARQVWEWAARGATAYAEMTNLPAPMRELLDEERAVLDARARSTRRYRPTAR